MQYMSCLYIILFIYYFVLYLKDTLTYTSSNKTAPRPMLAIHKVDRRQPLNESQ